MKYFVNSNNKETTTLKHYQKAIKRHFYYREPNALTDFLGKKSLKRLGNLSYVKVTE